jgi:hypothetical protein
MSEDANDEGCGLAFTSKHIDKIVAALAIVQQKADVLDRNATGQIGTRKYGYADFGSVRAAVKKAGDGSGLAIIKRIESSGLRVVLTHESEQWIDYGIYPLGEPVSHQAFGSALTYGSRYMEENVFDLAAEADDDGSSAGKPGRTRPNDDNQPEPIARRQAQPPAAIPPATTPKSDPPAPTKAQDNLTPEAIPPQPIAQMSEEELLAWLAKIPTLVGFFDALNFCIRDATLQSLLARWDAALKFFAWRYKDMVAAKRWKRGSNFEKLLAEQKQKLEYDLDAMNMLNDLPATETTEATAP